MECLLCTRLCNRACQETTLIHIHLDMCMHIHIQIHGHKHTRMPFVSWTVREKNIIFRILYEVVHFKIEIWVFNLFQVYLASFSELVLDEVIQIHHQPTPIFLISEQKERLINFMFSNSKYIRTKVSILDFSHIFFSPLK